MPEHVFISQVIDLNFTYRYTNIFTLSCVLAFKEVWAGSNYKNSLIQNIFLKCSILFMDFKGIALGQIVFVWQAPDHAKWQSIFLKWKNKSECKNLGLSREHIYREYNDDRLFGCIQSVNNLSRSTFCSLTLKNDV